MYQVIVGNIGTVYTGDSHIAAVAAFVNYRHQSKTGSGRAAGESVTLTKNGEPIREHFGTVYR